MRSGVVIALALAASLVASGGCRRKSGGSGPRSINVGGVERSYVLHAAEGVKGARALVLVLHGGGGDGDAMERLTRGGFDLIADREGAVVAYPNGIGKHWNDGRGRSTADDVGFLSALVDALSKEFTIDRARVFATGISNGGMMSYRLACDLGTKVAAVAPVAGAMPPELAARCKGGRAVPVLAMHGTEDPLVPWNGGEVHFGDRVKLGAVMSVRDSVGHWVDRDVCDPAPVTSKLPDMDKNDGTETRVERFGECKDGSEVTLYAIEGGGHTWPGGEQYAPVAVVGKTSRDFDAAPVIWEFFRRHPMK